MGPANSESNDGQKWQKLRLLLPSRSREQPVGMTAKRGPTGKESFENLNERLRHTLHQSKRTSEIPVKKKK